MESTAHQDEQPESLDTTGFVIAPLAAAAALDSAAFSKVNAAEAIPATWEERARKAWEYYVEEPLVKKLLRDYRRAEQAIAKRWTTPFRLLKVGGAFGQKMVMPDQKILEQVRDMVNKMDLKSGLVVPFYVTVETHGTEGQVLNVEDKVKEVKEDIVVALELSRSLVTGDGPNFATASVSLQKMLMMVREIKQAARWTGRPTIRAVFRLSPPIQTAGAPAWWLGPW